MLKANKDEIVNTKLASDPLKLINTAHLKFYLSTS